MNKIIKEDWLQVQNKQKKREQMVISGKVVLGIKTDIEIEEHVKKNMQENKDFITRTLKRLGATEDEIKNAALSSER